MVYSEVPNFSEPNAELLAQANQQNKSVSSHAPTPSSSLWQPQQPLLSILLQHFHHCKHLNQNILEKNFKKILKSAWIT